MTRRENLDSGPHSLGLVRGFLGMACRIDIYIRSAWGDDDDKDDPGHHKKTPKELADAVVQFERGIAHASLDLCVCNAYLFLGIVQ